MCEKYRSKHCDLSFDQLLNLRYRASINHRIRTKDVERLYPEKFRSVLAFIPGEEKTYYQRVDKMLYSDNIVSVSGSGTEFVRCTVLSYSYLRQMKIESDSKQAERKRLKNRKERIENSELNRRAAWPGLGIIGNNLLNPKKPVRDRRYKIQRYIQENRVSSNQYVQTCGCNISATVHLKKNREYGNCNFAGVATCGSVWACPVCRAKIINEREKQLRKIYSEGVKKGYYFSFLTLTFSHGKHHNLAALHGNSDDGIGLSGAITKMRQSYAWGKLKNEWGYIGDVRAVEVTYGKNGFHPHVHMVILSEKKPPVESDKKRLFNIWRKCCENASLDPPNAKNGVDFRSVDSADSVAYLAKWAAPNELVSTDEKEGKKSGHFSIAQLERSLVDPAYAYVYEIDHQEAFNVLKAYYAAMQGQKMLTYGNSRTGWRKELLGEDVTDQELTREEYQEKMETHLVLIDSSIYKQARRKGILNEIIERVEAVEDHPLEKVKCTAIVQQILYKNGIDCRGLVYSGIRDLWERAS